MAQRLHATDSRRGKTSVKTHVWLKQIGARFFKPITNRISGKLTVFNQEKTSSAVPPGHFVMYFLLFALALELFQELFPE